MILQNFIKKALALDVLFGPKAKKLKGIQDALNNITDSITCTAPSTILLSNPVPSFLKQNTYFRIKNGGGANQDVLFRVASVSGNTITVDGTNAVVNFSGLAVLDARLAIVHADTSISKINNYGSTIFNVNTQDSTGLQDGSGISLVMSDHYHDLPSGLNLPFQFTFLISSWFSSDAGDTYSIDVNHNLGTLFPRVHVFDTADEELWLHAIRVIDTNTVRIKVSQNGADGRFSGKGIVQ